MNTLAALLTELKIITSKAFAYDNPLALRAFGIHVVPVGARL